MELGFVFAMVANMAVFVVAVPLVLIGLLASAVSESRRDKAQDDMLAADTERSRTAQAKEEAARRLKEDELESLSGFCEMANIDPHTFH